MWVKLKYITFYFFFQNEKSECSTSTCFISKQILPHAGTLNLFLIDQPDCTSTFRTLGLNESRKEQTPSPDDKIQTSSVTKEETSGTTLEPTPSTERSPRERTVLDDIGSK